MEKKINFKNDFNLIQIKCQHLCSGIKSNVKADELVSEAFLKFRYDKFTVKDLLAYLRTIIYKEKDIEKGNINIFDEYQYSKRKHKNTEDLFRVCTMCKESLPSGCFRILIYKDKPQKKCSYCKKCESKRSALHRKKVLLNEELSIIHRKRECERAKRDWKQLKIHSIMGSLKRTYSEQFLKDNPQFVWNRINQIKQKRLRK